MQLGSPASSSSESLASTGTHTSEGSFSPELLGALEEPGVVRLPSPDYPDLLQKEEEEEREKRRTGDWLRYSCGDLASLAGPDPGPGPVIRSLSLSDISVQL